jgi:DNA polymerase-3 subunit delta
MSTTEDFKKIVKDVRAKSFKPVYLLHGEEAFFIDRVAEEIERNALEEHERDFNLTVLYGKDSDPEQVKDACLRYPMMAERQVVVLREANAWRIDAFDKLEAYFKSPTPTTVLVIMYKHKKADGRKAFIKEIGKKGVVFTSDKLKEDQLPDWITKYVQFQKRKIGQREAVLLAEHLGSDLGKMTKEVEKLCLVTEEGGTITGDLIQRNVGISKEYNIFELQNAIGRRDHLKAQTIAHYFAQDPKDHPLVLTLGLLNSYFNKLMVVHACAGQGQGELAAALKVPPFFVKDYANAARNYTPAKLREVQQLLRETDLKSKGVGSVNAEDGELLRELLARVMN